MLDPEAVDEGVDEGDDEHHDEDEVVEVLCSSVAVLIIDIDHGDGEEEHSDNNLEKNGFWFGPGFQVIPGERCSL